MASAIGLVPSTASAGLGTTDSNGWSWVDTKTSVEGGGGPTVISRYVTRPVKTATGDGLMSLPQLPLQTWSWATKSVVVPAETWTVSATSATSFTVVGSVSGAQANATLDTPYTSTNGMTFQVSAGSTAFVAGDKFVFEVVEHYDLSTAPGVTTFTMPATGVLKLPDSGMNLRSEGNSGSTVIAYESGYLALTTASPQAVESYNASTVRGNTALPAPSLRHDNAVVILPFWDELRQKSTSKIRTLIAGTSGSRNYVVEYFDFAHKDDPTASYTFQVVFFENYERIRFHYVKLQNGTFTNATGASATVGLQGRLINQYTASLYSANSASLTEGLTIEFGVDNDGDRLPVWIETQYATSDGTPFTDGGATQLTDAAQIIAGIDPTDPADNGSKSTDTDGDTLPDANEVVYGTNPAAMDTDGDGVNDNIELNRYNPLVADTDGDGLSDGAEDVDKDGTTNGNTESSPTEWDSDNDGVGDGTEVAQGTDKLLDTSSRMSAEISLGGSTAQGMASAVDSKGNLHVAWTIDSQDSTPNDLFVALFRKNPTTMQYELAVAGTLIDSHVGMDDRLPTIVTVPGGSNAAVDKTIIFNHSRGGYAFLTTIDFGLSALDGGAATSTTIVTTSRMLDFPVAVNHPQMKLAGGKLHVVFQGQEILGTSYFYDNHIARGSYYVQLDLDGTVTVPPVELFRKEVPSHHHTHPRIAVDSAGNVHSIVRGGQCTWNRAPTGCAFYYTKLSATGAVMVPTTKLQLAGNGGIHKGAELLVSPNGLVNLIYVTQSPLLTASGTGGYSIGNEVRLHAFSTVNNQMHTVIDQKVLVSIEPDATMGLPSNHEANTFRSPTATLDAGGNIHLMVPEDNNMSSTGFYFAFDPSGNRKVGPYRIQGPEYQTDHPIQLVGNDVLFIYKNGPPRFRHLDITGHGLDLSGDSQVPVPDAQALTLSAVTPPNVASGGMAVVTAIGSGFVRGTTVSIGGVALTGVTSLRPTNMTGAFDSTGLADGPYDVVVTNPDGTTVTLEKGFYVGDLPVTPTDDGCCDLSGSKRSPMGSLLLVALVALGLRRRRNRAAAGTIAAVIACAYIALSPSTASAGLGTRDFRDWAWADNKAGMPGVLARYTTVPTLNAGATGNGTIDQPTLPPKLWNWTTNSVVMPLETWTLTATSATTFTVVGSMSGAQTNATVGTAYTSTAGLNFTISNGGTAFVAGDTFTFQVVDRLDPATIPGAVSSGIPGNIKIIRPPFSLQTEGRSGNSLIAYTAGYLAVTSGERFMEYYGTQQVPNTEMPARILEHDNSVPLMPFWDELKAKPTSKIWTATYGRGGSRIFIVEYNDFAHATDATASYTFQVLFYENTDTVRFHYIKLQNGSGTSANGSTATIGMQGHLSDSYTASRYAANTASLVEGLVIEFGVDSDGDRIPNGVEAQYGTNPSTQVSDGGNPLISDSAQFVAGIDPTAAGDNSTKSTDTDGDTILDVEEVILGTNPSMVDTDGDGLSDFLELNSNGTDPLVADTDGDGLSDGAEDADKNGSREVTETSPTTWDSDSDGISDGQEVVHGTDKLLDTSSRLVDAIELGTGDAHGISTALDSKGNLHVAWVERNENQTPDDLYVALLTVKDGKYQLAVAPTLMNLHTGMDDRTPTIATVPGAAGSTVDRTVMINNSRTGFAFFTELDFGLATRDGTATTPATIVTANRMLNFPLAVNHPVLKASGNKVHLVFQGAVVLGENGFQIRADKGQYYVQLDSDGTVVVPPIELFHVSYPAHHHQFPRMALDATGNVHTVWRGGSCSRNKGTTDCAFYYAKLSSTGAVMIPTTKLQLRGNGGMHKSPEILVSPNGLVNVIYTTISPLMGSDGQGGYSVGNEVQLYAFSTVNNRITTVIDQKPLMSVNPDLTQGLPNNVSLNTYRAPAATLDAGGNIHLFVMEDQNNSEGLYVAFDPSGARKVGPHKLYNAGYYESIETIQVTSTDKVLFGYKHRNQSNTWVRELDITGSGLDLSGGSQVPLPEGDPVTVTAVAPAFVEHRGRTYVTVTGTGFAAGAMITIGGVAVTSVNAYDAANLVGVFDAETLVDGIYDVTVTNPDGTTATLPAAFTVGTPPTSDGGCCETGTGKQPTGAFLLALGVVLALRRRRRRS